MPMVLKLFIVHKTREVSSQCRFPRLSPEGLIQLTALGPRNLHFKQAPLNENRYSDAVGLQTTFLRPFLYSSKVWKNRLWKTNESGWKKVSLLFHLDFQLCQTLSTDILSLSHLEMLIPPPQRTLPFPNNEKQSGSKQVLIISEGWGDAETGEPVKRD